MHGCTYETQRGLKIAVRGLERVGVDGQGRTQDNQRGSVLGTLNRLLQAELHGRREQHVVVAARGADVGELLRLQRIHGEIVVAAVAADDLSLVDLLARPDEEPAPILQVEQCIGERFALGLRDVTTASELEQEIKTMGRKVIRLQMDVSDLQQINDAVARVVETFGQIDILVNNVGVAPVNLAENVTEADFDHTLNLNLKGTFFTAQAVGKQMIKQRSGRIINMSSQAGFITLEGESVYCMTKAGVNHLTKNLASEWAKYNINVNAVAPTFIETPGTEPWLKDKKFRQSVLDRIPLGRIGKPMEVAGAVVFLASDAASLITGEVLLTDGGWTTR